MKQKWEILIDNEANDCFDIDEYNNIVQVAITTALEHENIAFGGEISLLYTNHKKMTEINKEYRNKDSTTDCLSFPQYSANELSAFTNKDYIILGDIVINVEKVKEQAKEYEHTIKREIAFLAVHSLLHLLGYDHESNNNDNELMFKLQENILNKAGFLREV